MLLLYTAFCVILLYLSDVSLLNRLLRFLTILRFDVSIPNGYPRFFAISFVMFLYGTLFCVFFTMFFPLFRYAALRYCFPSLRDCFSHFALLFPRFTLLFPLFARLFPRFTLWLCTLSDGCAYVSLFADRGSIDRIDRLKCTQRYFFFQYDQNSTLSSNKTIERSNCCSTLRRSTRRNACILLHRSAFRSPNTPLRRVKYFVLLSKFYLSAHKIEKRSLDQSLTTVFLK